ncbi:hypothetical protein ACMX2H_15875 [Arthrobacter sulfonylureivorans]|uniref:hypothetical protein n=1 Tax=Arthrobacter sulfonylureivorans TaxID=2486855 RepID=UPI0039E4C27F
MSTNETLEGANYESNGYDVAMPKTDILGFQELADLLGIGLTSARTYHSRASFHRRQAALTGDRSIVRPGDLPKPDGKFGNSPYWERRTIEKWLRRRPGRGGRPATNSHTARKTA